MVRAYPEFASGEFLAFEFASDEIAVAKEAAFFGSGQADVAPDSYALANAMAQGSGQSSAAFEMQAVAPTTTSIVGTGVVAFVGSAAVGSTFNAPGQTAVSAQSGIVRHATFALTGGCTVQFEPLLGPGFDIAGVATVAFEGTIDAFSAFTITAQTQVEFVGQGVVQADAAGQASSTTDIQAQAFANANVTSAGTSVGAFDTWRTANTTTTIAAGASAALKGQTLANAQAQAQGTSSTALDIEFSLWATTTFAAGSGTTTNFETNALVYEATEFTAHGEADTDFAGVAVRQAQTHIEGMSEAIWRRGRQVFPSLVASPDATERPEENRVAEWA